ncbi:DUF58 domain-containing protein [Planctopirus hydrillae]|uniref:DUF58 domain-containing protein n=1 Tax=Planctopirus hydrillae TaxID=1841610 RepID=UPI0013F4E227|nr:DUF58 domain-containing protein [Planctopirus hydrillae]
MLDLSVVERLGTLELQVRAVVDSLAQGRHASSSRGFSIEFAQYREYTPGDDLRYVDWKVFGKSDRLYVKQFDDETSFGCQILIDSSESMAFRSPAVPYSKFEYARLLGASLGLVVLQQQDQVKLHVLAESAARASGFAGSWPAYRQMLAEIEQMKPEGKGNPGQFLTSLVNQNLGNQNRRRAVMVIVTDGLSDLQELISGLRQLRYGRHDVLLLQVMDRWERTFPMTGWTQFIGLEEWPDHTTNAASIREGYLAEYRSFQQQLNSACHEMKIDFFPISTDMSLDQVLRSVLQRNPELLPQ